MTKSQQAQVIYDDVQGIRSLFISQVVEVLGMSKAGASTYFQNCKVRAVGGKVKHYRAKTSTPKAVDLPDDIMEDAQLFEIELADGTTRCFLSQASLDEFKVSLLAA